MDTASALAETTTAAAPVAAVATIPNLQRRISELFIRASRARNHGVVMKLFESEQVPCSVLSNEALWHWKNLAPATNTRTTHACGRCFAFSLLRRLAKRSPAELVPTAPSGDWTNLIEDWVVSAPCAEDQTRDCVKVRAARAPVKASANHTYTYTRAAHWEARARSTTPAPNGRDADADADAHAPTGRDADADAHAPTGRDADADADETDVIGG